jgi:predicted HicB family RNase H-like nuclease
MPRPIGVDYVPQVHLAVRIPATLHEKIRWEAETRKTTVRALVTDILTKSLTKKR